jgi:hypothetical protein
MSPILLTEDQLIAIEHAAAVLEPQRRPAFLAAVAAYLRSERQVGDGAVHRAIRQLQHEFRDPMNIASSPHEHRPTKLNSGPPILA